MFASDGTYREQHDGDSQGDGGEDSQADEQQHGVELVHLGEGVEQLCLDVVCVRGDANIKKSVRGKKNFPYLKKGLRVSLLKALKLYFRLLMMC